MSVMMADRFLGTGSPYYTNDHKGAFMRSCKLHYDKAPIKIVRASKQYMYDDSGGEYLDCVNCVAHVGHCHPHVVNAGVTQMRKLMICPGFPTDQMKTYTARLLETLPAALCVCYFANSGSEANDLALRLAKAYTKREDIMVLDNSSHGGLSSMIEVSPQKLKDLGLQKKESVHLVPCPDVYRGKHRDQPNSGELYANEVSQVIVQANNRGCKIAAFLSEPLMVFSGVIIPPDGFLQHTYSLVRDAGGVCIANEMQTGLGRTGENFWGFQAHGVVPDILTCGKPLGNGFPMAVVVTTKEIAESVGEYTNTYGGNPLSCAIGCAVLDVIRNEQLLSSAKCVGQALITGFNSIKNNHPKMGDVRGVGLAVGVEIVEDKESRKPDQKAAESLTYKLKREKIILANSGPDKNVMVMMPPMCFTVDNARHVIKVFDKCLTEVESGVKEPTDDLSGLSMVIPLDVIHGDLGSLDDNGVDAGGVSDAKRARYDDID